MLMMVSVLVSAETMESAMAHQGMLRSGEEVGAQRTLLLAKAQAKPGDAQQIENNRKDIDEVKLH